MLKTITINTDTHVVVPVELLKKARLCIEDYIEGAPSDGTDEKCMDDISAILATKQPEQAQLSDFDPIVPESALEVGAKAVELAMQAGVTSPRTLALAAYTDIALTLHKAGQQPAPRQIPPINQELDEFISGLVAKELAKRGSRKIETAPRPVPTCDWQEDADGIWETSCGEAWVCTEGTPAENNMKFCHSCGKHLKEHRYAEPDGGAV